MRIWGCQDLLSRGITIFFEAGVPLLHQVKGVRFGCFNHFRKVSDACLSTWAKLLAALPEARLVLKGTTGFDAASSELTRRRLIRQGLDPDRIDWLPLTPTPIEHLQQYSKMDIALDCFPNTGCTTTCEALWMGVPVITLAGRGYVSRMGTAVLKAVGLDDWIAHSQDHYVEIAISKAQKLGELRSNRSSWRQHVQSSALGDTKGLFQAGRAFTDMAIRLKNLQLLIDKFEQQSLDFPPRRFAFPKFDSITFCRSFLRDLYANSSFAVAW